MEIRVCILISIIVGLSTMLSVQSSMDVQNLVSMITDLQNFYLVKKAVIIYNNDLAIKEYEYFTTLMKQTSRMHRYSAVVSQQSLFASHALSNSSKLLYVVLLNNEKDLGEFVSLARHEYLFAKIGLFLFQEPMSPRMRKFCRNPGRNWLDLHIGTELLVKCDEDVAINEWFSTGPGQKIQVREFMEWSPASRLIVKQHPSVFERRRNLSGVESRVAYIDHDMSYPLEKRMKDGFGYELVPKVAEELLDFLNVTIHYSKTSKSYGRWNKQEGKWNGIIGRLWNETIDIAATDLVLTSERFANFDFTYALVVSTLQLFIRMPETSIVPSGAYLKSFSIDVWTSLIGLIALLPVILAIIKFVLKRMEHPKLILLDNFMYVWRIFCQQGMSGDNTASLALKFTYFSMCFSAYILMSVYSGSLTSYVTLKIPTLPFRNLQEFKEYGKYTLLVVKNGAEHEILTNSNTEHINDLRRYLENETNLPMNYIEGFDRVCNEGVAFLATKAMLNKLYRRIPCDFVYVSADSVRHMAVALKKHNPLTCYLNHYIVRFREAGILHRLSSNYDKKYTISKSLFEPYNMQDILPLIKILVIGFGLSMLLLSVEVMHYYYL